MNLQTQYNSTEDETYIRIYHPEFRYLVLPNLALAGKKIIESVKDQKL